ncbi:CPS_collapsed_G0041430.mRNA.1.CDS.1 [Saccharomyces cerevisiae]|nr:CPS_collapsed_G0041430.mRNA.1.CDS.1 [Saccharomyces cerevisiae]
MNRAINYTSVLKVGSIRPHRAELCSMKLSTKLCWCGIKGRLRPQKQQQLHNTNLQMTELKKTKDR